MSCDPHSQDIVDYVLYMQIFVFKLVQCRIKTHCTKTTKIIIIIIITIIIRANSDSKTKSWINTQEANTLTTLDESLWLWCCWRVLWGTSSGRWRCHEPEWWQWWGQNSWRQSSWERRAFHTGLSRSHCTAQDLVAASASTARIKYWTLQWNVTCCLIFF